MIITPFRASCIGSAEVFERLYRPALGFLAFSSHDLPLLRRFESWSSAGALNYGSIPENRVDPLNIPRDATPRRDLGPLHGIQGRHRASSSLIHHSFCSGRSRISLVPFDSTFNRSRPAFTSGLRWGIQGHHLRFRYQGGSCRGTGTAVEVRVFVHVFLIGMPSALPVAHPVWTVPPLSTGLPAVTCCIHGAFTTYDVPGRGVYFGHPIRCRAVNSGIPLPLRCFTLLDPIFPSIIFWEGT